MYLVRDPCIFTVPESVPVQLSLGSQVSVLPSYVSRTGPLPPLFLLYSRLGRVEPRSLGIPSGATIPSGPSPTGLDPV